MLMYCGYELSALGWRATVSGEGESMELVARHVEHYLRDHSQRGECKRKNGDYLLRNIDDRKQMVTEISEWANSVQKETRASAEAVALWKSQISEVTTNGFQHGIGNSIAKRPLLIAGKASEDHSRVQLAALDFGKSIPVTIANEAARMHVPIGDGDRIRFACRKGVTSHSTPINQGSGLFNLIETVKKNGGSLAILSRNGLLHVVGGRCYKRNLPLQMVVNPLLQGTLTVVNLKIC